MTTVCDKMATDVVFTPQRSGRRGCPTFAAVRRSKVHPSAPRWSIPRRRNRRQCSLYGVSVTDVRLIQGIRRRGPASPLQLRAGTRMTSQESAPGDSWMKRDTEMRSSRTCPPAVQFPGSTAEGAVYLYKSAAWVSSFPSDAPVDLLRNHRKSLNICITSTTDTVQNLK